MLHDARVSSLVENRQDKVLRLDMGQVDGDNELLNAVYRESLGFNKLQKLGLQLLNALPFGVSISEIIWERKDGLLVPVDFVPIPRQSFRFEQRYGVIVPVLNSSDKILNDPFKFIIHRNDRGTGSASGVSILKSVYWPWKFKRLGFKFWVMAAERIGVPSIIALFDTKNEEVAKKRAHMLAGLLQKIRSGSSLALGNTRDVKYLNAEGALKDFDILVKVCNTEISYGLTGQSLTTNESQYGTRANAILHDDTFAAVITKDAQNLQSSMQVLFDWFGILNYPNEKPLKFDIDSGEYASWEVVTKAIELGIPISKRALYNRHKIPKPENEDDVFVSASIEHTHTEDGDFADKDTGSFFF